MTQVIKSEIKGEKFQLLPQKYKGLSEITMNNCMPRNWTIWTKWGNSQKHNNLQKVNQEKSENLKRMIATNKIKAVI